MSKGLGKIQKSILEYLKTKDNSIPPKWSRLTGNGWIYASTTLYHVYKIPDGESLTNPQYKAGMRAIDRLAKSGLIEKVNSTGTYSGLKRGRLAWNELEKSESELWGLTRYIFIRIISVD